MKKLERKVQTGSFEVQTESGKSYTVNEITTQILQQFQDGTDTGWMNGSKQYRVGSGFANKINDTTFEIVETGEEATRV